MRDARLSAARTRARARSVLGTSRDRGCAWACGGETMPSSLDSAQISRAILVNRCLSPLQTGWVGVRAVNVQPRRVGFAPTLLIASGAAAKQHLLCCSISTKQLLCCLSQPCLRRGDLDGDVLLCLPQFCSLVCLVLSRRLRPCLSWATPATRWPMGTPWPASPLLARLLRSSRRPR